MQHDNDDHPPFDSHEFAIATGAETPAHIVIGEQHQPLVTLTPCELGRPVAGGLLALDADQCSALSALLQAVPGLAQSTSTMLTRTYRVSFAPDVASRMSRMQHAAAKEPIEP